MNDTAPDVAVTDSSAATTQSPEPGPGQQLHEARERLGLTVADVARNLKLHPRQVEALERDAFTELPGPVFVRGFMRNYARLVGLEGETLVALAERVGGLPAAPRSASTVGGPRSTEIPASLHEPLEKGRARKGWLPVTAVLILLAAAIVIYNSRSVAPPAPPAPAVATESAPASAPPQPASGSGDAGTSLVPPPAESGPVQSPAAAAPEIVVPPSVSSPASPSAPAPAAQQAAPTAATPESGTSSAKPAEPPKTPVPAKPTAPESKPAAKPETREGAGVPAAAPLDVTPQRAAGGPEIRLSFSRESWVEVRDASGSVIFSQLNPAGTERVIRGQPPFQVTVGNAGGVSVRYNAREIDLGPSTRTDVAHITLE